jgi:hypothetical protein
MIEYFYRENTARSRRFSRVQTLLSGNSQDCKGQNRRPAVTDGRRLGFYPELFDLAIKCGETQPHELGSVHFVAAGLV